MAGPEHDRRAGGFEGGKMLGRDDIKLNLKTILNQLKKVSLLFKTERLFFRFHSVSVEE